MRAAIYFTPPAAHPLTEAAALWLGRDAFTGEARSLSARDGENERDIREITAEPRRYGFHATIKAPFRLAANHSLAELDAALADFCRSAKAPAAPTLCLRPIGSFFALTAHRTPPASPHRRQLSSPRSICSAHPWPRMNGATQDREAELGAGPLSRAMGLPLRARRVSVSFDPDRTDCVEPATLGPRNPGEAVRRIRGQADRHRRARGVRSTSTRSGLHRAFTPSAVGLAGMSVGLRPCH